MSDSLGGTTRGATEDQLEENSRRRGSGRVLSAIALAVAVITLLIVLLLRMCASPESTVTPPVCEPGMSAYEVWLSIGNEGSVEDFLADLVGAPGADGYVGADGFGGQDGASAYQLWLDAGNTGTPQQFLDSLIGATGLTGPAGIAGISAYQLWIAQGNTGTEPDFLASLVGEAGQAGADGQDGATGQSAYELWLLQPGNAGKSEVEFLASLIGPIGPQGECTVGDTGPQGPAGADGADGLSAFEVWLESNPGGTIEEFYTFITGPQGPQGVQGIQGIQGPKGDPGTSGIASTYRGTFLSLVDQSVASPNTRTRMYFEDTYISNGVTITRPDGSTCTIETSNRELCNSITFANAGTYNIQFSAQLHNTGGGGSGEIVTIWLGLNGNDATYSATNVTVSTSVKYQVASWNFFLPVNAGDKVQLFWSADNTSLRIEGDVPAPNTTFPNLTRPGIPSIILTVNQVG